MNNPMPNEFEKAAAEQRRGGLFSDLWGFLRDNKKWWLLPILIILLLFGVLVFLSGTGVAPFIYTLF
jgi:drug/metabolite transporter superfamily protein YnfA